MLRGKSQNEIARAIRVSKSDLARVISGIRSNAEIRQKFADHLGMLVSELFDAEFDAVTAMRKEQAEAAA